MSRSATEQRRSKDLRAPVPSRKFSILGSTLLRSSFLRRAFTDGPLHSSGRLLGKPIDFGGHDEIVFMQAFDLLRLQRHHRVAPPEADVGVMPFGLGKLADLAHERQRLAEVLEPESALDLAGLVAQLPLSGLLVKALGLLPRQWRDAALAGRAGLPTNVPAIFDSGSIDDFPFNKRRARPSVQPGRHSLVGQLLDRLRVLCEMRQPHAAQHMRRLCELDVVVADDLDAVAPGVEEVQKAPRQRLDACRGQRLAHRLLVVDHQPEMPAVIGGLPAALLQGEELIAEIDESGIARSCRAA